MTNLYPNHNCNSYSYYQFGFYYHDKEINITKNNYVLNKINIALIIKELQRPWEKIIDVKNSDDDFIEIISKIDVNHPHCPIIRIKNK